MLWLTEKDILGGSTFLLKVALVGLVEGDIGSRFLSPSDWSRLRP
jgi:hypothetical protein